MGMNQLERRTITRIMLTHMGLWYGAKFEFVNSALVYATVSITKLTQIEVYLHQCPISKQSFVYNILACPLWSRLKFSSHDTCLHSAIKDNLTIHTHASRFSHIGAAALTHIRRYSPRTEARLASSSPLSCTRRLCSRACWLQLRRESGGQAGDCFACLIRLWWSERMTCKHVSWHDGNEGCYCSGLT